MRIYHMGMLHNSKQVNKVFLDFILQLSND